MNFFALLSFLGLCVIPFVFSMHGVANAGTQLFESAYHFMGIAIAIWSLLPHTHAYTHTLPISEHVLRLVCFIAPFAQFHSALTAMQRTMRLLLQKQQQKKKKNNYGRVTWKDIVYFGTKMMRIKDDDIEEDTAGRTWKYTKKTETNSYETSSERVRERKIVRRLQRQGSWWFMAYLIQ